MNCDEFEEISGAYALGALTDDELIAANDHLASCDQHHEMGELQAVAAGLAAAAPERAPPPALKSRLMDAIRAESSSEASEPAFTTEAPSRGFLHAIRGLFARPAFGGYALSGALAIVIAALAVWNVTLQSSEDEVSGEVVSQLSGQSSGEFIVLKNHDLALLEIDDLPPLDSSQVYQLWAITDGQPASLGAFSKQSPGNVRTAIPFDPAGVDSIAITVEPAPGSQQPTSDPVVTGDL
ncbi:MAG: anti-sigma factor [Dehalococcoidia bacterium]